MKILVCTGCSKEVITFTNDFNFHFFNFGIIMCSEECYNKMSGLHNTKKYIITCRGCSMKTTIWQINEDVSIFLFVFIYTLKKFQTMDQKKVISLIKFQDI